MWPKNIFLLDFALVSEMLFATDLNKALIKYTDLEQITAL